MSMVVHTKHHILPSDWTEKPFSDSKKRTTILKNSGFEGGFIPNQRTGSPINNIQENQMDDAAENNSSTEETAEIIVARLDIKRNSGAKKV